MRPLLSPSVTLRALPWLAFAATAMSAGWAMDALLTTSASQHVEADFHIEASDSSSRVLGCDLDGVADGVGCYDPPTTLLCTMLDAGVDADCRSDAY